MKKILQSLIPLCATVIVWEFVSRSVFVNASLFPPPSKVIAALWEMLVSGTLMLDIKESLWRMLVGLGLGSFFGICVGLVTGRSEFISRVLNPLIQSLRPLPPVAIIPLIIVWFGIDNGAKIFSISFAVFFPVWIASYLGSKQISKTYIWSANLCRISKFNMFRKIIFPASLPFIVSGIRTAIAIGFVMVFVSELSGASSGLGYRISISSLSYRIDEMMAALAMLGALGAMTDQLFVFTTRRLFPWLAVHTK